MDITIDSLSEAKDIARSRMMSKENIAIAKQRALTGLAIFMLALSV